MCFALVSELTATLQLWWKRIHHFRWSVLPVMMAGSIQLAGPSQLRLWDNPPEPTGTPVWLTLDEEEDDDEDEEALGCPPKLMLMFGKSALRPSCHSFIFILSRVLLLSAHKHGDMKSVDIWHRQIISWNTTRAKFFFSLKVKNKRNYYYRTQLLVFKIKIIWIWTKVHLLIIHHGINVRVFWWHLGTYVPTEPTANHHQIRDVIFCIATIPQFCWVCTKTHDVKQDS